MNRLAGRLWRAARRWPNGREWAWAAGIGALSLAAMAAVGFASGLYALGPPRTEGLALRLVSVLFVPAIGEEAVFRGLLVPGRDDTARPWLALVLATAVFVAWHVLEATTFLRAAAPMFLRPDFLACTAILGAGCGLARWRTASLWPPVAIHWLMVVVWQTWLGGFSLA